MAAVKKGGEYWNRLINSLPENSVIRREIAAKYAQLAMVGYGDFDYEGEALEQANKAVELNPNNPYPLYDLARLQADLGDIENAIATLQQANENCKESICRTLIDEKENDLGVAEEQEENKNTFEVGFLPEPGPTYFCNDANRQTMRRTQPLIEWESREFGWRYEPDDRCTYVSNRLESYETQGLLAQVDRITYGIINRYRVLCIATDETAANDRNCIGGQLIVTLGSVNRTSESDAEAALTEFKNALRDPNYDGSPLDNIKGVKGLSKPE
jgi:tetratricopeptide (TPR) repeat protein